MGRVWGYGGKKESEKGQDGIFRLKKKCYGAPIAKGMVANFSQRLGVFFRGIVANMESTVAFCHRCHRLCQALAVNYH